MKSGKKMNQVKEILAKSGRNIRMVENCGMPDEHIYNSVEEDVYKRQSRWFSRIRTVP